MTFYGAVKGDAKFDCCSVDDIGTFFACLLAGPDLDKYANKTLNCTGPDAVSYDQVLTLVNTTSALAARQEREEAGLGRVFFLSLPAKGLFQSHVTNPTQRTNHRTRLPSGSVNRSRRTPRPSNTSKSVRLPTVRSVRHAASSQRLFAALCCTALHCCSGEAGGCAEEHGGCWLAGMASQGRFGAVRTHQQEGPCQLV